MKMNWKRWNFEPVGNSVYTTEYFGLGKTLLARPYLKVKVHMTNLLSI